MNAFAGLTSKSDVCKNMFERIKGFAEAVSTMTDSIINLELQECINKVSDMCRCICLCDVMRQFAEEVGKLMKFIVDLFKETSERLSCLWAALDYCKNCLSDCLDEAAEAKQFCITAFDHGGNLIEACNTVKGELEGLTHFDAGAVETLKTLASGEDLRKAIDLAQSMDDVMLECVTKVVDMASVIRKGWEGLPPILTEGIEDLNTAGKEDDDPDTPDTAPDVEELDNCKTEMVDANLFDGIQAGMKGFDGVNGKVEKCKGMLELSQGFSDKTTATIESFNGTWNIETMANKIKEICRCATLAEMIQQFAQQIKQLVMSILALLQAAMEKFGNMDLGDVVSAAIPDSIEEGIANLAGKFGW